MRWFEVFSSVLQRHGYTVGFKGEDDEGWNGNDDDIFVTGDEKGTYSSDVQENLWDFVENMHMTKYELLKECVVLVTRHFDERVKSFIKNILYGTGTDKVTISHHSYRVEFQARGMPHIHGVAWIDKQWLKKEFGIEGPLAENKEKVTNLANLLTTCKIPKDDENFADVVTMVQKHKHTKSCKKYGTDCRFGFPKLPSEKTIVASPLPEDLDDESKAKLEKCKTVLSDAKDLLLNLKDDEFTFDEFIAKLGVSKDDYHDYLSITNRGKVLVLKRDINERFINNYNEEMLRAWNANMDLQIALDPYAVITYMVSYAFKPENSMTQFLKNALSLNAEKTLKEKLIALKKAFLTNRQLGAAESTYKSIQGMKLKDSNIKCDYVPTGFPENRSVFYQQVGQDVLEEGAEKIEIEGRSGFYKQSVSVVDRYSARPKYLENMVLAQFSASYVPLSKLPEKVDMTDEQVSEDKSEQEVVGDGEKLPSYIELSNKLGFMRLRTFPAVIRYHTPKNKEGHEKYYTEMQLFSPWKDEIEELKRYSVKECNNEYQNRKLQITNIKQLLYPDKDIIELLECEHLNENIPQHIYDTLDNQREQEKEDDLVEVIQDDPVAAFFEWQGQDNETDHGQISKGDFKYREVKLPRDEDLMEITRSLVDEQKILLSKVVEYCKKVVRQTKSLEKTVQPLKFIVHGGAGNYKFVFFLKYIAY